MGSKESCYTWDPITEDVRECNDSESSSENKANDSTSENLNSSSSTKYKQTIYLLSAIIKAFKSLMLLAILDVRLKKSMDESQTTFQLIKTSFLHHVIM